MTETLPGFPPPGWDPQYQRLDGETVSANYVREVGIHIARSCVGLKPSDPTYYDALYPWDIEAHRKEMAKGQSKCALNVLMILRAMGYALPWDGCAYAWSINGSPPGKPKVPDAMTAIQKLPGWRKWKHLPEPGDVVVIGRSNEPSSTHALVVVDYEDDDHTVVSVDGGMGAVREAKRDIVQMGSDLCLYDKAMGNRPIIGTVDLVAMRDAGLVVRDYCLPDG